MFNQRVSPSMASLPGRVHLADEGTQPAQYVERRPVNGRTHQERLAQMRAYSARRAAERRARG